MNKYKYIFVVLVYKNADDLAECVDSIKNTIESFRVVVVNSYFDEETKQRIEKVAKDNDCDFINVENKGYSFGNNRGIEFAKNNYDYEYIVVSNPDIIVKEFNDKQLDDYKDYSIIAPYIITKDGRRQNPMAITSHKFIDWLQYKGMKNNSNLLTWTGLVLSKISRTFLELLHIGAKKPYKIYVAHGSFVIFRKAAIDILYPVYDENVFLFAEEGILAVKARKLKIKTGQFNSVRVFHKEDGSMKLANISINDECKKANIYYYETYIKKSKE